MEGTATEITICGHHIKLGDKLRVEYTTGVRMLGAIIEGSVVELWEEPHLEARLSCGWCFHDYDRILCVKNGSSGSGDVDAFGE